MVTSPEQPAAVKKKLDALTSLRFFAAVMILLHHASERGLGPQWIAHFALGQGVSFFFILSGFVLAYNYPSLIGVKAIGNFYLARIGRIWPSHIAATVLYIALIGNISYYALPQDDRTAITLAYAALVQAWVPLGSYYTAYNTVSWSISTEFFFYLAFPILIWNWRNSWRLKTTVIAFVTVSMWWLSARFAVGPQAEFLRGGFAYINPLARIFEFILGIAVCQVYRTYGERFRLRLFGYRATLLEFGVVGLAVLGLWGSRQLAHHPAVLAVVGKTGSLVMEANGLGTPIYAFAILVFALGAGFISRVLSTRPLIFLGEISFGLYLLHTLFLLYRQQAPGVFVGLSTNTIYALYWACALAGATLLHMCIEVPAQRLIRDRHLAARGGFPQLRLIGLFPLLVAAVVLLQPSARWLSLEPTAAARNELVEPAIFDGTYRLDAVELLGSELRFSWTAVRNTGLAKSVAVHLLDDGGNMVGQLDFLMETGYRHAPVAQQWSNFVSREGVDPRSVKMLGIAVYDYRGLSNITGSMPPKSDWNGQRLLIPLR